MNTLAELLDNNAMLKEMFVSLKDQGVKPTEFFKALEKELGMLCRESGTLRKLSSTRW